MKKIMVVDGSPDYLALMAMLLEDEDCRALIRSAGEGAFQMVKREKPDLVVLDLVLPDGNGLDLLRMLKADAETARIPTVVSTAALDRVDAERTFLDAAGTVLLPKPYGLDDLLLAVGQAGEVAKRRDVARPVRAPVGVDSLLYGETSLNRLEDLGRGLWREGSAA